MSSVAPTAVRRQARAAAQVQAQANARARGDTQAAAPPPAPNTPAPTHPTREPNIPNVGVDLSPGVEWKPVDLTRTDPQTTGVAPGQSAAPAPAPEVPGQPSEGPSGAAVPVQSEPNPYKQRYDVLRGKYNAEITSRDAMIRQQAVVIDSLQQRAAQSANPTPQSLPRAASLEERAAVYGWSRKDIEDYGAELVERMIGTAEIAARTAMQPVAQQMQAVGQQVGATAARTQAQARQGVYDALNREVGADWILINDSPEFLDWVGQPDLFSGQPRQVGLMEAFESGDAARVVSIFKAFQEEDAKTRATATRQPAVDAATLLAPGQPRSDGSVAPTGSAERIWSEEEIGDFYARVQRGRVKPAERKETEAQIMAAVAAGRVRPSRQTSHLLNSV